LLIRCKRGRFFGYDYRFKPRSSGHSWNHTETLAEKSILGEPSGESSKLTEGPEFMRWSLSSHASVPCSGSRLPKLVCKTQTTARRRRETERNHVASSFRLRPSSRLREPIPTPQQDQPRQATSSNTRRLPRRCPRKPLSLSFSLIRNPSTYPSPMLTPTLYFLFLVLPRPLDIFRCGHPLGAHPSTIQRA
jgi:hypothetical protein